MKKTLISLATASLIASSAMAADKGIDLDVTGQAVVYYQTAATGSNQDLFSQNQSKANVGVQLNVGSDLGNGFVFGSQLTYLGTAGLEKNLVSNTMQTSAVNANGLIINGGHGVDALNTTSNQIMLTKVFVAKKMANTTVKIGRQELPKSLSPLAFTEGWNVFKNTFDAIVAINTDLPDTTLVGAYVGRSTGMDLSTVGNLNASTILGSLPVTKTAYMLTAANTSLPMTTLTASYYALSGVNAALHADAIWLDAKIADKSLPMGLNVGIQAGSISADTVDTTTAFGLKASAKPMAGLTVTGAFSSVDDGALKIVNTGGVKTPLYTQMVANQGKINHDNTTMMLKGAYSLGDAGTVIAQTSMTSSDSHGDNNELDLVYVTNLGGAKVLAAYVYTKDDAAADATNIVRVWARYAF